MTSTAPGGAPPRVTQQTVHDAWLEWAGGALGLDELDLAQQMLTQLPHDLESEATATARAQVMLLQGRTDAARAELASAGVGTVGPDGPATWAEATLTAVHAARGHAPSMHALLAARSRAVGSDAVRLAYLIAAAAQESTQHELARQAWRDLAIQQSVVTPLTVARFAAAEVAARDRDDPVAAVETVMTQVNNLTLVDPDPAQEPSPVLAASAELRARGDDAGARLLLEAVVRTQPPHVALTAALREVTPQAAMRRHALLATAAFLPAVLLVPVGPLAIPVVALFRRLWYEYVRLPGLGRVDSDVLRGIRSLRFDANRGQVEHDGTSPTGWYGVGGILGLTAGAFAAVRLSEAATASLGPDPVRDGVLWVTALVGAPTLGVLAAVRVVRRRRVAAGHAARARAERQLLASAGTCRCWTSRTITGALAAAYLERHLEPVTDDAAVREVRHRLGDGARVVRCPSLGMVWVAGAIGRHRSPLALRGVIPTTPSAGDEKVGLYL